MHQVSAHSTILLSVFWEVWFWLLSSDRNAKITMSMLTETQLVPPFLKTLMKLSNSLVIWNDICSKIWISFLKWLQLWHLKIGYYTCIETASSKDTWWYCAILYVSRILNATFQTTLSYGWEEEIAFNRNDKYITNSIIALLYCTH